MSSFSSDNRRVPKPNLDLHALGSMTNEGDLDVSSKVPRLLFELSWEPLENEMDVVFKNRFNAHYPVTQSELAELKRNNILESITEARDFVVDSMKDWPHLSGVAVDHAFVKNLEEQLAKQRGMTCDL